MIKNARTHTEFVAPTGGSQEMTQDKSWGVNAHIDTAEGWMD